MNANRTSGVDGRDLTEQERARIVANASGEDVFCGTDADALKIARDACDDSAEWSEQADAEAIALAQGAQ